MTAESDHLVMRGKIQAILADTADPAAVKAEALRRVETGMTEDWKPGDPPPDRSIDARWRRAIAARPEAVLSALQRRHEPASARVFGNSKEFELVLPGGAGRLIVKWLPPHA